MGSSYSELSNLDDNDLMLAQSEQSGGILNFGIGGTSRIASPRQRLIHRPAVHTDSINWLSPVRPEMLVSCSSDKTIALNNMDTGACLTRWRGHEREVTKVVYKHVGCRHFLLSGSKDCTLRLWNFNTPECCQIFIGHEMGISGLAALDENQFVSGGRDGRMCLWDMQRDCPVRMVGSSQNLVTHIEPNPETKLLLQTAEDGTLRLWDAHNLSLIDQLLVPASSQHALWHCSISPAEPSSCLTAGGGTLDDGCEISMWDLRQCKRVQCFRGHEADVRSVIFLHHQQVTYKRLMLSVSSDRTARLWDLNTGRCVWTENVHAQLNSCVAFSDGSVVVAGAKGTLCELRLLVKTGKPYLQPASIQTVGDDP